MTPIARGVPVLAAAAVLVLAAHPKVSYAQVEGEIGIPIGATPPAVAIEDLEGQPVDLSEFIGHKPVLIEFWATWCPLCKALLPRIEAARERYGSQVEFLVISVAVNQTKRSIRRHLVQHPILARVLWDTNGRATRAFQAPTTSYVVVLDAQGRVAYTGVGKDQDIDAAIRRVVHET